ncbi:glycosyltransferase family 4 protein [Bdellovibrio sp. HCB-110]|uniref:glycosyltransferase family 4 protein n=1 Tax=Bdellovibrio sp. HCB-110 TaxID=3391182 RepID=UPI0039B537BB
MMRILYINHYAGSLSLGMEFRPFLISREWKKMGHDVKIIASVFSHLRQVNPKVDRDLEITTENGITYQWIRTPQYHGNGILRFINILVFVVKLFLYRNRICCDFVPDIVIASSTYPLDVLVGYFISKKYKAKLVHEVHDLWPLTLLELGKFKKWHPLIVAFQFAENFSCRNAHRVVSMLENTFSYLQEKGLSRDRFVYVPNGIVKEDFGNSKSAPPQEMISLCEDLKQKGFFIFGYAGAIGVANAMEFVLEAMKQLRNEKIALVLVGKGEKKLGLSKFAEEEKLENVYFFDSIPKSQVADFLGTVDAAYIGWHARPIYRFGINPNKILDYMMAGRPIFHSVTAGNDWVLEAKAGISVPAENVDAIAHGLREMSQLPSSKLQEMGENGKNFVKANHLYENLAKRFLRGLY